MFCILVPKEQYRELLEGKLQIIVKLSLLMVIASYLWKKLPRIYYL